MTHKYQVTGMTCSSCESKVKSSLLMVENVINVEVLKDENSATITMDKHIALDKLQNALPEKYQISATQHNEIAEQTKSWLETYKPILLIFFYIILITGLVQFTNNHFDAMQWMQHFMAGFFLVFSFFKLLNLKGFAESYVMYDVLAKRIPIWAYAYTFVELGLAIAYTVNFNPFITNLTTLIVMSISIIGVLQSVLNKRKIQCACLGVVFNLPMSTVTIIEDALMIVMSASMLFVLI
jgi:cation transport ATPase